MFIAMGKDQSAAISGESPVRRGTRGRGWLIAYCIHPGILAVVRSCEI